MKTKQSVRLDLHQEMQNALDRVLSKKKQERQRLEAKGDTKDRWYAQECYTTAQEVAREMRESHGAGRWGGKQFHGLNGIPLLHHVRDFLLSHPKLTWHNSGRGHVSGARFRTDDMPMSESEKNTKEKKAREKPIHIREPKDESKGYYHDRKLLCQVGIERKPSWRGRTGRRFDVRTTEDPTKVTCKRCLRLIADINHANQYT